MSRLRRLVLDVLQTAFRLVPWPTEPGLRKVGDPGPESPVLITGNYDLTVRRLQDAMAGDDAWVVVASSRGINVWCAAAGGLFTTSDVVTALKTSGVADLVRHRRAILPQLAATGVVARDVARRTGWKVRFGPVYARDIPRYVQESLQKDDTMRAVRFGVRERVEMAAAWAAPTSLVALMLFWLLQAAWVLPAIALVWVLSLAVFFVYDRIPVARWPIGWVGAVVLSVAGTGMLGGSWAAQIAGAVSATVVFSVLTFDFDGSTPIRGGSHFESKRWRIGLDLERCAGVYSCWAVCPEACFEKDEAAKKVALAHDDRCVRCGACVVQCPQDALAFTSEAGERIAPETIRRYKLNLLGTRGVDTAAAGDEPPAC